MDDKSKKDLQLLSEIITTLNKRRVELEKLREDSNAEIAKLNESSLEIHRLKTEKAKLEERIGLLNLLQESKQRELLYLSSKVSEKELKILSSKNLTTAEANKLSFLTELRDKTTSQLKDLHTSILKGVSASAIKESEITAAEKHLEVIKQKAIKEQEKLDIQKKELEAKISQNRKVEQGLLNQESYLNRMKARLQQFADENGINIKL